MDTDEFKLIVAGGRDFQDYDLMTTTFLLLAEELNRSIAIVSGAARGADTLAMQLAKEFDLELYLAPADWDAHGKAAGYIRNRFMAENSDGLLAYWDGKSRGTKHMIETMQNMKKPVRVIDY